MRRLSGEGSSFYTPMGEFRENLRLGNTVLGVMAPVWQAFCTFIQDVRGRYKMSKSETRFEIFGSNMKKWTQHGKMETT